MIETIAPFRLRGLWVQTRKRGLAFDIWKVFSANTLLLLQNLGFGWGPFLDIRGWLVVPSFRRVFLPLGFSTFKNPECPKTLNVKNPECPKPWMSKTLNVQNPPMSKTPNVQNYKYSEKTILQWEDLRVMLTFHKVWLRKRGLSVECQILNSTKIPKRKVNLGLMLTDSMIEAFTQNQEVHHRGE